MELIKYTLKHPIDGQSGKIETLRLKRPTFKDMKAIGSIDANLPQDEMLDVMGKFIARLSGITIEDTENLDVVDFLALSEIVSNFFPQTPAEKTTP